MQYSVCDYLIDIIQNSVEAEASAITLDYIEDDEVLRVCIGDNGKGMDEETLKKAKDPFYTDGVKHSNRKVGLGLPFLIQMVENVGGDFDIKSDPEIGTSVFFSMKKDSIDFPAVGDLSGTFRTLLTFTGNYELSIKRQFNERKYSISRNELIEALGDLETSDSLILAGRFLKEQEDEIQ